jgi:hypothetical protein
VGLGGVGRVFELEMKVSSGLYGNIVLKRDSQSRKANSTGSVPTAFACGSNFKTNLTYCPWTGSSVKRRYTEDKDLPWQGANRSLIDPLFVAFSYTNPVLFLST